MDLEFVRNYCLKKVGSTEDFPFDNTTLVVRIGGKIFALMDTESIPFAVNLKCNPERAIELREHYSAIIHGWHMNKKHWNTVTLDQSIPIKILTGMIDHSYELVFNSLKKSDKDEILNNYKG